MTILFMNRRVQGYVTAGASSAVVLGISAWFVEDGLPNGHMNFSEFALAVSCLTLVIILFSLRQLRQARATLDACWLLILAILWLAVAAWSQDLVGHANCGSFPGSDRTPTKSGSITSKSYCYSMHILEAFSWITFSLMVLFLIILIHLADKAVTAGMVGAWNDTIYDLPWFGEISSIGGGMHPMSPNTYGPQYPGGYAAGGMPYVVQRNPGQAVFVEPSIHGGV